MAEMQVAPEKTLLPTAPRGLGEIVTTFGDIYGYIRLGGSLIHHGRRTTLVELPFFLSPGVGSFEKHKPDDSHKRMAETFVSVFDLVQTGVAMQD